MGKWKINHARWNAARELRDPWCSCHDAYFADRHGLILDSIGWNANSYECLTHCISHHEFQGKYATNRCQDAVMSTKFQKRNLPFRHSDQLCKISYYKLHLVITHDRDGEGMATVLNPRVFHALSTHSQECEKRLCTWSTAEWLELWKRFQNPTPGFVALGAADPSGSREGGQAGVSWKSRVRCFLQASIERF